MHTSVSCAPLDTVLAPDADLTTHVCLSVQPSWLNDFCSRPNCTCNESITGNFLENTEYIPWGEGRSPITSIICSALTRSREAIFCLTDHTVSWLWTYFKQFPFEICFLEFEALTLVSTLTTKSMSVFESSVLTCNPIGSPLKASPWGKIVLGAGWVSSITLIYFSTSSNNRLMCWRQPVLESREKQDATEVKTTTANTKQKNYCKKRTSFHVAMTIAEQELS